MSAMFMLLLSVMVAVAGVLLIRLLPEPKRTSNALFREYFTTHSADGAFSRFRILQSAADTGGAFFEMEEVLPPSCGTGFDADCVPPYHIHPRQNETFTVVRGSGLFKRNGEVIRGEAGDTIFIPAGAKHHFARAPPRSKSSSSVSDSSTEEVEEEEEEDLVLHFKLEPAGRGEKFFLEFVGLMRDSHLQPQPMLLLWLLCEHDVRLAEVPALLHDFMCGALSVVNPLLGYRVDHSEYDV